MSLWQSVKAACDQTKTSARLVQHTSGKIYVFDCPKWSNSVASVFKFKQPNAVICVEQASTSLSGFVLVIEEKKAKNVVYRIWASLFATLIVYAFLWFLLHYDEQGGNNNNNNGDDYASDNMYRLFSRSLLRFLNQSGINDTNNNSNSNNGDSHNCSRKM